MTEKKICYVVTLGQTIKAFFIDQSEYLADKGYDVTIICDDNYNLKQWLSPRINLIDIKIPRGISFRQSIKSFIELLKVFKKEKYDLVQYSTPNAAFLASLASKFARIPIRNYHLMGLKFEGYEGIGKKILIFFEKIACRNSTHIECVSRGVLEKGVFYGLFPKEKAVVVGAGSTGGVNTEKFNINNKPFWRQEIRKEYNIPIDAKVFGFAGRIAKDKGISELCEAFDTVQKHIDNVSLMLVGPVEDAFLTDKIKNIKNVILVPRVDDIERYYSAWDVALLPSYREGFGNLLIEAETMGVPCIASDIDGPRDAMVNNETGYLIPVRDVMALSQAMLDIIKEENYRSRRHRRTQIVSSTISLAPNRGRGFVLFSLRKKPNR